MFSFVSFPPTSIKVLLSCLLENVMLSQGEIPEISSRQSILKVNDSTSVGWLMIGKLLDVHEKHLSQFQSWPTIDLYHDTNNQELNAIEKFRFDCLWSRELSILDTEVFEYFINFSKMLFDTWDSKIIINLKLS